MTGTAATDSGDRHLVRTYVGYRVADIVESYWKEAQELSRDGYEPTSSVYIAGSWNAVEIFIAVLTIPVIIGVFLTVRLLVNRPTGSLVVTYSQR